MSQLFDYGDILAEAPWYLGYVWAADRFCRKHLGVEKENEWRFMSLSFAGWLLLNVANRQYPACHMVLLAAHHVFFAGLVLGLFKGGREKKFLAAVMLMMTGTLVRNFCESLFACATLIFMGAVMRIGEPFLGEAESCVVICASLAVVTTAVWRMSDSHHFLSIFRDRTEKWYTGPGIPEDGSLTGRRFGLCPAAAGYVILAIPMLVITVMFDVAGWGASNGIMVRSGGRLSLYCDQILGHLEFCVLAALSMFAAGVYVLGMDRLWLEQEKSGQYHVQIEVYKMMEEQYRQSERLRHDMKNHIIALSGLFENREWEKLGEYLTCMKEFGTEQGGDVTGSKAVDALLYQKRKLAEREMVEWECDVEIPGHLGISEFDLCVLFGNILDNALEACRRMRQRETACGGTCFVRIQSKRVKKYVLFEVKNSVSPAELCDGGSKGSKRPWDHGIGLMNVRDVVHKYNGVVDTEAEDGVFTISILVPAGDGHGNRDSVEN